MRSVNASSTRRKVSESMSLLLPELDQEALAQVARADAGRIELLDDADHLLDLGHRVVGRRGKIGGGRRGRGLISGRLARRPRRPDAGAPSRPALDAGAVLPAVRAPHMGRDQLVHRAQDLLERRGEVALFVDVAEELLGQEQLARAQGQHLELLAQVVDQVAGLDRDRLGVLQLLELLPGAADLEAVEEDLLPVHLLFLLLLLLLLLRVLLLRRLLLRLEQLEEGIGEQLLLQVLLEVHHGHVQHVHRLVEPRIDPQLLAEAGVLGKAGLHATASRRARRRAVRVGPR